LKILFNLINLSLGPKGRKQGSPVRIFTNVNLQKLKLPASEGYRYCGLCKKWISPENKHCSSCNSCTSKVTILRCKIQNPCLQIIYLHRMEGPMYIASNAKDA
jgi:hypothetical protein